MIIHELVLWSLEQVRVPFSIPITLEFQVQSQLLAFDLDAEEFWLAFRLGELSLWMINSKKATIIQIIIT